MIIQLVDGKILKKGCINYHKSCTGSGTGLL